MEVVGTFEQPPPCQHATNDPRTTSVLDATPTSLISKSSRRLHVNTSADNITVVPYWLRKQNRAHRILTSTPPLRVHLPRLVFRLVLDHPTRGKRRSCPFRAKLRFDFMPPAPENTLHRRCSGCGTRRGAITGWGRYFWTLSLPEPQS